MAKFKNGDNVSTDGSHYVEGLIPGIKYAVGLLYESGTATMNAMGQSLYPTSTVNTFYEEDGTTALTVTATTPRAFEIMMAAPVFRFTIASASSLNATLVVQEVHNGQ